jgi:hypothetical protein
VIAELLRHLSKEYYDNLRSYTSRDVKILSGIPAPAEGGVETEEEADEPPPRDHQDLV